MKRVRRTIQAAQGDESKLQETIDALKDDFDYIISGLDKLDRSGAEASNEGLIIAEGLQSTFQEVISSIGGNLS